MDRLLIIIAITMIILVLVTYFISRFTKNKRYLKYLPAVVCLIFAIVNFFRARLGNSEGFQDIARMIMGLILFAGFISGTLTGIYLDRKRR